MKMESFLLISLSHILKTFNLSDEEKKKTERDQALEMILEALSKNSKNAFLWFIKGYLEFSSQKYEKALEDLNFSQTLIEESNDKISEELIFLKGMALSYMQNYMEAAKQFFHLIYKKQNYV